MLKNPAKDSPRREPCPYICGLGARFEWERASEHSNRRDESHKYALFIFRSSSIYKSFQT